MASTRETAMLALVTALETTNALVSRDTGVPETIPPEGLIVVAEGAATIEPILSPLSQAVEQIIDIDVHVVGADETARASAIDDLLVAVSTALTDDRTLGGVIEFLDVEPPDFEVFEAAGAAKAARLSVILFFTTISTPLT